MNGMQTWGAVLSADPKWGCVKRVAPNRGENVNAAYLSQSAHSQRFARRGVRGMRKEAYSAMTCATRCERVDER